MTTDAVVTALLVLSAAVVLLTLTVAFSVLTLHWKLKRLLPVPVELELETFEVEGCGTRCCRGLLPPADENAPLVPATAQVSAEDVAASARRKASRDRVDPETVTQIAESH